MKLNKFSAVGMVCLALAGCNNSSESQAQKPNAPAPAVQVQPQTASVSEEVQYVQIERLGRPAINEGLVKENANLNAFNSIPPTLDLRADISAVLDVQLDAVGTLTAVGGLATSLGLTPAPITNVVTGFLPDVMRIDTSANIGVNETAYNHCFDAVSDGAGHAGAQLACGRKIKDDVMDITLSYLLTSDPLDSSLATITPSGAHISDGVGFDDLDSNGNRVHQQLLAGFPYLASPR